MPRATQAKKRIRFRLDAPAAHDVRLAGDFTDWGSGALHMNPGANGRWTKQISLEPGDYQYRFIVDGQWWSDPACEERVPDGHGGENSLRHVAA